MENTGTVDTMGTLIYRLSVAAVQIIYLVTLYSILCPTGMYQVTKLIASSSVSKIQLDEMSEVIM